MTSDKQTILAKLLSDILDETVAADKPDALLAEEYGATSMDIVEIVMSLEQNFNVRIPDEDIPGILTLGDLLKRI